MTAQFSVFIPVWNGAQWLPMAVESILAQSYAHWELVIGDNVSTDDVPAVVASYPDPRIRYHRWSTHTDLYENFNRTALLCRYDWILPLCADDRLDPRCLEAMAARIEQASGRTTRLAMVVSAVRPVDVDGHPADDEYFGVEGPAHIPDGLHDAAGWLRHAVMPGHAPWNIGSVAIARDLAAEIGGFFRAEHGVCADIELPLRVAAYGDVAYIDQPLLEKTMRLGQDSRSRGLRKQDWENPETSMGSALLSGLRAHAERRDVCAAQRAALYAAVARSHLQRAAQHRYLPGGRGRRGALREVGRGLGYSPRTVLSPKYLAYGLGAIFAPRGMLEWARASAMARRYPPNRRATALGGTVPPGAAGGRG